MKILTFTKTLTIFLTAILIYPLAMYAADKSEIEALLIDIDDWQAGKTATVVADVGGTEIISSTRNYSRDNYLIQELDFA